MEQSNISLQNSKCLDVSNGYVNWLSHLSPSVVCLQETHALSSDELSVWFSRFGYMFLGSFGSSYSCGVAIL